MNKLDDRFNRSAAPEQKPDPLAPFEKLDWSEAIELQTRVGPRLLRKAFPNQEIYALMRTHGDEAKRKGYTLTKNKRTDEWEICHWAHLPETVTKEREEIKQASRATDADIDVPRPEGQEYLGYQKAGIAWALRAFGDLR